MEISAEFRSLLRWTAESMTMTVLLSPDKGVLLAAD